MKLILGNSKDKLKDLETNSVDSIVTDPPYGLSFMGKKWDYDVPSVEIWREALRVLKPGGYLLSFAGSRTYHRMAVNIEDAGFEIRDQIMWIYGSGFPKSHNISKAIDKSFGAERKVIGSYDPRSNFDGAERKDRAIGGQQVAPSKTSKIELTESTTDEAKQWDGWGTALKPAHEPIVMARKPLSEKTIVQNVLKHGTGGINIDESRVGTEERTNKGMSSKIPEGAGTFRDDNWIPKDVESTVSGRFPANIIHDGSNEVTDLFPDTKSGKVKENKDSYESSNNTGFLKGVSNQSNQHGDSGNASRFFYCAKASKKDRNEGNNHPTVKPTELMKYLVRMVTPPKGTVLDPFMGSGSTGKACKLLDFDFIGIELDPDYIKIAKARIENAGKNEEIEISVEQKKKIHKFFDI